MNHLKVVMGLICLMPKLSLSIDWALITSEEASNVTYWEEKCRVTAGESYVTIAKDAKTRSIECANRIMSQELVRNITDRAADLSCKSKLAVAECEHGFYKDVLPCINEAEAKEIRDVLSKIGSDLHGILCDGGNTSLMHEFYESDMFRCMKLHNDQLQQCIKSGEHRKANDALLSHARGESTRSFKDLYCRSKLEAEQCFAKILHSCENHRAEAVYQKYRDRQTEMKICQLHQSSGSERFLVIHAFATMLPPLILTKLTHWPSVQIG